MSAAFDWGVRSFLHEFRLVEGDDTARREARLPVLLTLLLHANIRLRCWPSTATLCRETGFAPESVVEAREWLLQHHAVILVPYDKRVGDETTLPGRQFVYQLTGAIQTSKGLKRYLNMSDDSWRSIQVEIAGLEGNVSPTEVLVDETFANRNQSSSIEEQVKSIEQPGDVPSAVASRRDKKPRAPVTIGDLGEVKFVIASLSFKYERDQKIAGRDMARINTVNKVLAQRFEADPVRADELKAAYGWYARKPGAPSLPKVAEKVGDMLAEFRAVSRPAPSRALYEADVYSPPDTPSDEETVRAMQLQILGKEMPYGDGY